MYFSKCYQKRHRTKKYNMNNKRNMYTYEILYKVNLLSTVKTYRSNGCRIYIYI